MKSIPKIKFSQLLASVKTDLRKYADEGLIDPTSLIKVVHRCNDILGINIYDRKQVCLTVENGQAELPMDLYKVEMAFIIGEVTQPTGPINPHVKKEYVVHTPPEDKCKPACICDHGTTVCVYPVHQPEIVIKYNTFTPMVLSGDVNKVTGYSPNYNWKGKYKIDLDDKVAYVGFQEGHIFLSYLSNLVDPDTGELLIPFHGRLNDYYEYSVKTKIFEDLIMNSEAEVQTAYAIAKRERNLAAIEAIDFTMSKSYTEWAKMTRRREIEFYNDYYSMF